MHSLNQQLLRFIWPRAPNYMPLKLCSTPDSVYCKDIKIPIKTHSSTTTVLRRSLPWNSTNSTLSFKSSSTARNHLQAILSPLSSPACRRLIFRLAFRRSLPPRHFARRTRSPRSMKMIQAPITSPSRIHSNFMPLQLNRKQNPQS